MEELVAARKPRRTPVAWSTSAPALLTALTVLALYLRLRALDTTPPWIPLFRALGINIAHIFDFHGDGHPNDPGPLRLPELENYFAACARHSDNDFLVLPGEEANAHLGGHYNILFPKPVYWTHVRTKDQPLIDKHPNYGTVYHAGSAAEVFAMMQKENALVWQTHPRTKGSTGYPDKIKDADLEQRLKALPLHGQLLAAGVDPRGLTETVRYRPSANTRIPLFGAVA